MRPEDRRVTAHSLSGVAPPVAGAGYFARSVPQRASATSGLALPLGIPPLKPEDHLVLSRQCRLQARDFLLQFLPTRSFLRQEHAER